MDSSEKGEVMEPEPDEVLSEQLEVSEKPKTTKVVHIRVGNQDASAAMAILEQMAIEKVGTDIDVTFVISTEERRLSGGCAKIEGVGVSGHLSRERKLLAAMDDAGSLPLAAVRSLRSLSLAGVGIDPAFAIREGKKDWQVERYGLLVRKGASVLKQTQRQKRGKRGRRG